MILIEGSDVFLKKLNENTVYGEDDAGFFYLI
jgi:hypothetical protein